MPPHLVITVRSSTAGPLRSNGSSCLTTHRSSDHNNNNESFVSDGGLSNDPYRQPPLPQQQQQQQRVQTASSSSLPRKVFGVPTQRSSSASTMRMNAELNKTPIFQTQPSMLTRPRPTAGSVPQHSPLLRRKGSLPHMMQSNQNSAIADAARAAAVEATQCREELLRRVREAQERAEELVKGVDHVVSANAEAVASPTASSKRGGLQQRVGSPLTRRSSVSSPVSAFSSSNGGEPMNPLYPILDAKFAPLDMPCPSVRDPQLHTLSYNSSSGGSPPPNSSSGDSHLLSSVPRPMSQAQVSRVVTTMSTEFLRVSSVGRRDRRNCLRRAFELIRQDPVLVDCLKSEVHRIESENEEEDQRKLGLNGGIPQKQFWKENRTFAEKPLVFRSIAKEHREEQAARGVEARRLHSYILEARAKELEEQEGVVRGQERSLNRRWACILSFLFSTRAVNDFLNRAKTAERRRLKRIERRKRAVAQGRQLDLYASDIDTDPDDVSSHYHNRGAAIKSQKLSDEEALRIQPLLDALKETAFFHRMSFLLAHRRAQRYAKIRNVMRFAANFCGLRKTVHRFVRAVRCIQRAFRAKLQNDQWKREFLVRQYETLLAERLFYTRQVCAETAQFEKKKAKSNAAAVASSPSGKKGNSDNMAASVSAKQRNGGGGPAAAGKSIMMNQTMSTTMNASFLATTGTMMSGTDLESTWRQSPQQQAGSGSPNNNNTSLGFYDLISIARRVATPWLAAVRHRNGRFGPDPQSARLVALETHPFYVNGVAKVPPTKLRDRILALIREREDKLYRSRLAEWRVAQNTALDNYRWLKELAVLQEEAALASTMRSTGASSTTTTTTTSAQKALAAFVWPPRPLRRILIRANEMRLVVLCAFAVSAKLNANTAASTIVTDEGAPVVAPPPAELQTTILNGGTAATNNNTIANTAGGGGGTTQSYASNNPLQDLQSEEAAAQKEFVALVDMFLRSFAATLNLSNVGAEFIPSNP